MCSMYCSNRSGFTSFIAVAALSGSDRRIPGRLRPRHVHPAPAREVKIGQRAGDDEAVRVLD